MTNASQSGLSLPSGRLICVPQSMVLPASTIGMDHYRHQAMAWGRWLARWATTSLLVAVLIGTLLWLAMQTLRPRSPALPNHVQAVAMIPSLPQLAPSVLEAAAVAHAPEPPVTAPSTINRIPAWAPRVADANRNPADHAPVDDRRPVRVRVVTIRARVTAYTAYDHAVSHPQWADGLVAWHPGGRQRRVSIHPYGLATDWNQFPAGATFIRVPGYMGTSFPSFPEAFRVVDDKCGRSRRARRLGQQPIIDVRFMTRHSAISGRGAWGSRDLPVEVIYPEGFRLPADLRRWVIACEWHTYHQGKLVAREPAPLP